MFDRNPHIATTNPTDVTAAESDVATLEILGIELEVPFRQ
jgi:hypothetical protein